MVLSEAAEWPKRFWSGATLTELWTLVVPLGVIVLLLGQPLGFVDLGYHLRAGEWMWEHAQLLDRDIFTSTVAGHEWLNQNWLAQLTFYGSWRAGGLAGIAALNASLFGLGFALLFRVCLRRTGEPRTATIASVIALAPALVNMAARPQAFSWLLLIVLVALLEEARERPRIVLWAPVVIALWSNLHGGFAIGLLFMIVACGTRLWEQWWSARRGDWTFMAVATFASLIAAMLNPWGWRVYGYVLDIGSDPTIRSFVDEWRPPTPTDLSGVVFFASVFAVGAIFMFSARRPRGEDLVRVGICLILALIAIRNSLWWSVAAAPALATALVPLADRLKGGSSGERRRAINSAVLAALVVTMVLASPWVRVLQSSSGTEGGPMADTTPVGAAAYLRDHRFSGTMFNSQPIGSYLEWAAPDHPTFVDSRIELFPSEVWHDYATVRFVRRGWEGVLDARGVGYVVLDRSGEEHLAIALAGSAGWTEVFRDDDAVIFVRRSIPHGLGAPD